MAFVGGSGSLSHSGGVLVQGGVLVGEALAWVKDWSMRARKRAVEVFDFFLNEEISSCEACTGRRE